MNLLEKYEKHKANILLVKEIEKTIEQQLLDYLNKKLYEFTSKI